MRIFITIMFLFFALPYYLNKNISDSDKWKTLFISVGLYFFIGIFLHWGIVSDTQQEFVKNLNKKDIKSEIDREIKRLNKIKNNIDKKEDK